MPGYSRRAVLKASSTRSGFRISTTRSSSRCSSSPSTGSARTCRCRSFGPIRDAIEAGEGSFLQLINLFSGGALGQMAVFGLGIMPYITSSIIMQLLTVVIPKLQALQDQGEVGVKKINQYTRYVTVVLAVLQSTAASCSCSTPGGTGLPDPFPPRRSPPPTSG